jgi:glycosyltransferase 2 family protein
MVQLGDGFGNKRRHYRADGLRIVGRHRYRNAASRHGISVRFPPLQSSRRRRETPMYSLIDSTPVDSDWGASTKHDFANHPVAATDAMAAEPMKWLANWPRLPEGWLAGWQSGHWLDRRLLGRVLPPLVTAIIVVVALLVLHETLKGVRFGDVWLALTSIPLSHLALSVVLVAASYLFLTGYDQLCLRFLGKRLPFGIVTLGSFISYAFANNLGFALLTGGSVRYQIFKNYGVSTAEVAIVTVMSAITFILSATLVVGSCMLLAPDALAAMMGFPVALNVLIGTALLTALAVYVGWVASGTAPKTLAWGKWSIDLPGVGSTLGQFLVGCGDIACAAGALYILLPASTDVNYFVFVGIFAAAITLGLISSVPGGVGVFEGIILFAVPNATADQLIASLLAFRCAYYLLPLLVSLGLLIWHETSRASAGQGWSLALRAWQRPSKSE